MYEKEYLDILMAVDQWRCYLQHDEFHIVTDHKSLVQLTEQRLHTSWQKKVFTRLIGLQYRIIYRQGADNGAADALSRAPHVQCSSVSVCQPRWLDEVRQSYTSDASVQDLFRMLESQPAWCLTIQSLRASYVTRGVSGLAPILSYNNG